MIEMSDSTSSCSTSPVKPMSNIQVQNMFYKLGDPTLTQSVASPTDSCGTIQVTPSTLPFLTYSGVPPSNIILSIYTLVNTYVGTHKAFLSFCKTAYPTLCSKVAFTIIIVPPEMSPPDCTLAPVFNLQPILTTMY